MAETTVYRARRVVTLTPAEPEAFAVAGGRVVATGRLADLHWVHNPELGSAGSRLGELVRDLKLPPGEGYVYVAGEVAMQQKAALEFLAEAEPHHETASLCLSHRTLGTTYVQMGEFVTGRQHLERARELYDPEQGSLRVCA